MSFFEKLLGKNNKDAAEKPKSAIDKFFEAYEQNPELFKHREIIDAFVLLGYDIKEITIRKGWHQEEAKKIIEAYGFNIEEDMRRFPGTPQDLINEFVDAHFEKASYGLIKGIKVDINMVRYFDENIPDWRNAKPKSKGGLFKLSDDELTGNIVQAPESSSPSL